MTEEEKAIHEILGKYGVTVDTATTPRLDNHIALCAMVQREAHQTENAEVLKSLDRSMASIANSLKKITNHRSMIK